VSRIPLKLSRQDLPFSLLVAILGIGLLVNFVLLGRGHLLAVVTIIVQTTVLTLTLAGFRYAAWAIRIWAGLLILTGTAYWLSVLFQFLSWAIYPEGGPLQLTRLTLWGSLSRTFFLLVGVFFWKHARNCVRVKTSPA